MNLGEANIVLRHRPGLEVVDLTLRFVRALAPSRYFYLSLITLLPAWLACLVAHETFDLGWPVIWLGALCASRVLELPFTVLSGKLLFSQDVALSSVLREALFALPRLCVSLILYGLLMSASLLLVVGPLFVGASYFFLPEVLVLERAGPLSAFRRASRFLSGRSGTGVEGLMLRAALLLSFILLSETLGQALFEYVFAFSYETPHLWEEGGSPFALLGLFLFVPYGATHRFLCYINERTRQDGWDVQIAFLNLRKNAEETVEEASHAA